jgi:hypothetical protein
METSSGLLKSYITALGTTGAGKTTFTYGMYHRASLGVGKLALSCIDLNQDALLARGWRRMLKGDPDRFGTSTPTPTTYVFRLTYALRHPLAEVTWLDYRGGDMSEPDENNPNLKELLAHLARSDTVILCVSGEYLTREGQYLDALTEAEVRRMQTLLTHTVQRSGNVPTVIILLTKCDLCFHARRKEPELVADIREMFPLLFEKGGGWTVMICPVTLGRELATNRDFGTIAPENVDIPVVFGMYNALQRRFQDLDTQVRQEADREKGLRKRWGESKEKADGMAGSYQGLGKLWYRQTLARMMSDQRQLAARISAAVEASKVPAKERDTVVKNMGLLLERLQASNVSFFDDGIEYEYRQKKEAP